MVVVVKDAETSDCGMSWLIVGGKSSGSLVIVPQSTSKRTLSLDSMTHFKIHFFAAFEGRMRMF